MIDIAPVIRTKLLDYHSRTHLANAPTGETFPYVTFNFPTNFTQGEMEIFNLDVDIWGNNPNTTEIDTIANNIWNGLNRMVHVDEKMKISIYKMNRMILDDDDPQIERRKLIFQLRYLDRGLNNE